MRKQSFCATMHSLIPFIVCFAFACTDNADTSKTKMEQAEIVPDVIDKAPDQVLDITYALDKKVDPGAELTPTQVKDPPTVKFEGDADVFYTLAMVDPDAPSRENHTFREVNHWLVGNMLGGSLAGADVVTEYLGSGPPKGTGLHRYIFLLFKQEKKLEFDEPRTEKLSRAHRLNFNLRNFVKKYNLGEAVAGNFYKAQWDPYVDERNEIIAAKQEAETKKES